MLPPPIPQHLLAAMKATSCAPSQAFSPRHTTSSHTSTSHSASSLLPFKSTAPSAPPAIELADYSPRSPSLIDPLYYDHDPYAEARDDSKYGGDDDGIRMYEVDLDDRRQPPPVPPRPSWSPSVTSREQSTNSTVSFNPAHKRNSLSTSTSYSTSRYVHSSEPHRPPTVLDPQQLQARVLTESAEECGPLWFRIHNTVLRLHPISFDDLPEMTQWLNRAKFSSDRIIHDTQGRVLYSLRWLMSEAGAERFDGMRTMVYKAIRDREARVTTGTTCDMEFFFYGDDVGILYTEWQLDGKRVKSGDGGMSVQGCCVIS